MVISHSLSQVPGHIEVRTRPAEQNISEKLFRRPKYLSRHLYPKRQLFRVVPPLCVGIFYLLLDLRLLDSNKSFKYTQYVLPF